MAAKRKKARSAPLLVIKAVDRATLRYVEAAIKRITRSGMNAELKREAMKALRYAIEPRIVNISSCNFTA